ncbi:drug/metabolite transporter (DMT)-like permease [Novosphingobium chloroacetimidivorans]|uniref:Drug/metabolite transporter (DMT)-like permease n=1 Tax=Novosphingobium chloroacetimidivorans TaxID=1428314 RepID=A0A7W7NXT6_9SPHN|nr:DMT family transporter [Novosphingobium chloroacetimidivorans]MBB4859535.1 drug/metabolite transporter (DMT)-like permease [Novosphingobium chloroacetimidivorans]
MFARLAPALFVLIWSSGFIVARWAVPHGAPELILLARMVLTSLMMGAAALVAGERWPTGRRLGLHVLAGAMLNGVYLCTSWWAVSQGMPAGVMALLGALQPLVVAVGAFLFLGERLPARGWAGLGIALIGVVMVLEPLLESGLAISVPWYVVAGAVTSILAMAVGTMIQSGSLAQDGIRVSSSVQNAGGAAIALGATMALGDYRWDNSLSLWLGLAWSVLMLSAAALSLLVWMTRRQGATRVSVLLLLVPPLTAIESRLLFGEHLITIQLLGFALALGGVLLARSGKNALPPEPA